MTNKLEPVYASIGIALDVYSKWFDLSHTAIWEDSYRAIVTYCYRDTQYLKEYILNDSEPLSVKLFIDLCKLLWVDEIAFAAWCERYEAQIVELYNVDFITQQITWYTSSGYKLIAYRHTQHEVQHE